MTRVYSHKRKSRVQASRRWVLCTLDLHATWRSRPHGDHPWPSLVWKCKMASFVCSLHTGADHRVARPFRNYPPHGPTSGGHMFNKKIWRNKMNDRQWCGYVSWHRSCKHTGAYHRVARPFRNRWTHEQPPGGHYYVWSTHKKEYKKWRDN